MSWWNDLLTALWPHTGPKVSGTPGDQKPHDSRGGETVDSSTGIGTVDGQIVANTSIDPETQDKEKGFQKVDDDEPMDRYGDTL